MAVMPHVRCKYICYYEDQDQSSPYNREEVLEIVGLRIREDANPEDNVAPYFRLADGVTVVRPRGNGRFMVEETGRLLCEVA